MTKIQHCNIRISGRVQGVGFRYAARKTAIACRIRGYVRNEYDGSVYIQAEGSPENMETFIEWCRRGPDSGRVTDISVETGEVIDYSSFSIRF